MRIEPTFYPPAPLPPRPLAPPRAPRRPREHMPDLDEIARERLP